MKTRNGLVSNSSSSSFVLFGLRKPIHMLTESDISTKTVIVGRFLGEGTDVFSLTDKRQLQFVLDNPEFFVVAFNNCLFLKDFDSDGVLIDLNNIQQQIGKDKVVMYSGEQDFCSSGDIETMIRNYSVDLEAKLKTTLITDTETKYGVKKKEKK